MKFRKKPVVVEAIQFLPNTESYEAIAQLAVQGTRTVDILECEGMLPQMFIQTLEGRMEARVGDWIIRGVSGELYPCKPDIFMLTYEPVEVSAEHMGLECPHGMVDTCCSNPTDCVMGDKK